MLIPGPDVRLASTGSLILWFVSYFFSRRWLFNKCHFIGFIRIILIDKAYYLKENLIGIFPVGVVFLFISFVKYI